MYLAVDTVDGMIVAQTLIDQDAEDPSRVGRLLNQIGELIGQVTANGVPSSELDPTTQCDRHLATITERGRLAWQVATDYGQRSLVNRMLAVRRPDSVRRQPVNA